MKKTVLFALLVLLSVPNAFAQELAIATAPTVQVEQVDLSNVPTNFVKQGGSRRKGVACMVTGGIFIVAGIPMIAVASHGDPKLFSTFLLGVGGTTFVGAGVITFILGGVMYLVSGPGSGRYSSHISGYNDPNHVGLAYNF